MNTGTTGHEPLLKKRAKLNYFIDDAEYCNLPTFQTTLWDQVRHPHPAAVAMCVMFAIEKFFFLLAVKQAKECEYDLCRIPIAVLLTVLVSAVAWLVNIKVREPNLITGVNSQALGFAVVGVLDACYLFMLFAGSSNLSGFSLSVQLQTPIVLMLLCRLIFTGQSFKSLHYLGALFMLAAIIVDIQQTEAHGGGASPFLVFFAFLPHTISQMMKLAMLRTGAFCCMSFNKFTLTFTGAFSIILLVLVGFLDTSDGGKWSELKGCFYCLFGGEHCGLEPLYLVLFILATLCYQSFVYWVIATQIARMDDYSRIAASLSVPLSCGGFALATLITRESGPKIHEWAKWSREMYRIGITGPVGSGKTALTKVLAALPRTVVVDVDQISRGMYTPDTSVYKGVVDAFRQHNIIDDSGIIIRRKLGELVFSSPAHLETLNSICFPYLKRQIEDRLEKGKGNILAVIDAGVLLQAGWDKMCDEAWTTVVKDEVAIRRIMQRDRLSESEARFRVHSQFPLSQRLQRCKVSFETNGTVEELEVKVHRELQRLQHLWQKRT